ncbi:hypothetical protein HON36_01940 [Candidatus Parcubacteria bacterium]|jgi:hypothetical protein|nr:hypothetical protein [Candidatus Parcubacteria bacterium]MBT7228437.1 hypothetical protein [Candidatus Parcubacteria bacterium]
MKKYCEEFKSKLSVLWLLQEDLAEALGSRDLEMATSLKEQVVQEISFVLDRVDWYYHNKREMIVWFEEYFKKRTNKFKINTTDGVSTPEALVAKRCRFDIENRRIIFDSILEMQQTNLRLPPGLTVRMLSLEGYLGDYIPEDLQVEKAVYANSEPILGILWEMKKAGKIKGDINPGNI